jgi:DNA polymerase
MPIGAYDLETRSTVNLTLCGAWNYAAHPSTSILCMYIAVDGDEPIRWLEGDPPLATFFDIAQRPDDWQLVAHNHEFERAIYELVLIPRFGFPPIPLTVQHCTQQLASRNAYPAELGLLSQALGLPYRKDPAAAKAMRELSRPRKPRRGEDPNQIYWVEDEAKRQLVFERCRLDVITTRAVWTHPKLRHPSVTERNCQVDDAIINRRGIRLDRSFVEAAQTLAIQERNAINLRLAQLTAGSITSVDQVKRFVGLINERGHAMTTLNKRGVTAVLASKPDAFVRELLELRRKGARASARKFARMLMFANAQDDRLRGTLRWHGGGPGRWVGLGPQLQNLDRNDVGVPLEAIELVRAGDRAGLARYGNPLTLIGSLARGALCAAPGHEFLMFDYSSIESRDLAWLAGETWKLDAYREFDRTGDKRIEPYRITAAKMLGKELDAITKIDRQTGKIGDLSAGFGGSVGAWRRQIVDERSDFEVKADIEKWRRAHPRIVKFWHDLARCIRIAIKTGQSVYVGTPPGPTITAHFEAGNLYLTLPSGRAITYPEAHLVPSKFEGYSPDVAFKDNAHRQWKDVRGWHGTFTENVVQGIARDILVAAIARMEARGLRVVLHVHDDLVVEAPIGSVSPEEFQRLALEPVPWAEGLPLAGKARVAHCYLEEPEEPLQPQLDGDAIVETVLDSYLDDARTLVAESVEEEENAADEGEDDDAFLDDLDSNSAPLGDLVSLPLTGDGKASCPFHEDPTPSLQIYPDHWHCFGCHERGDRIDWLTRVEGMNRAEALTAIQDWEPPAPCRKTIAESDTDKITRALALWNTASALPGSLGERYLSETRGVDLSKLPTAVHDSLRFHPRCPFGSNTVPCILALMRDPVSDLPVGIHRIGLQVIDAKVAKIDRMALGKMGVVKFWPANGTPHHRRRNRDRARGGDAARA